MLAHTWVESEELTRHVALGRDVTHITVGDDEACDVLPVFLLLEDEDRPDAGTRLSGCPESAGPTRVLSAVLHWAIEDEFLARLCPTQVDVLNEIASRSAFSPLIVDDELDRIVLGEDEVLFPNGDDGSLAIEMGEWSRSISEKASAMEAFLTLIELQASEAEEAIAPCATPAIPTGREIRPHISCARFQSKDCGTFLRFTG